MNNFNKNLKIAVAQISSIKGDVSVNINLHLKAIKKAKTEDISIIVFPELSLTGYEPEIAEYLAFKIDDIRLLPLIEAAKDNNMYLVVGAPIKKDELLQIGAIIISPKGEVSTYSKMNLHSGENAYFSSGKSHVFLEIENKKIAIAICADTNNPEHVKKCVNEGADIYLAGVLITENGYQADTKKLKDYALNHKILVGMANHNAPTGGWEPIGKSSIWSPIGDVVMTNNKNSLVIAEEIERRWIGKSIEI
ncbi:MULTISPECIES: carbon-nitrogen hydrolase family protein [Psychrilyobacter]|uniref:Carbon-nitrogen hydrolase family protein n=1 Tax=Psychrilyobacter piezotolerans TaxID=2293438 RepID=A0ABX9KHP5_9FUSO|nr:MULTISPECIES: carbon-nitrogen hydrolase family protein [Psychrilyobacter]MCS5423004.1 carbon-nitrogen hydrolase family protein [Psychrilyobacter sp. S5]NDI77808.1 carbon-nitrogen hydrolase family protein [Psychrilyobacter piezotolerans]RDE62339.1 carbon-nitrogen hydrolase family protein [Psychrilyobacter sp. S5]REI41437.1 carbon-nitrogen hydrolase family protein [Psychrilyobacter piezotolerans]